MDVPFAKVKNGWTFPNACCNLTIVPVPCWVKQSLKSSWACVGVEERVTNFISRGFWYGSLLGRSTFVVNQANHMNFLLKIYDRNVSTHTHFGWWRRAVTGSQWWCIYLWSIAWHLQHHASRLDPHVLQWKWATRCKAAHYNSSMDVPWCTGDSISCAVSAGVGALSLSLSLYMGFVKSVITWWFANGKETGKNALSTGVRCRTWTYLEQNVCWHIYDSLVAKFITQLCFICEVKYMWVCVDFGIEHCLPFIFPLW